MSTGSIVVLLICDFIASLVVGGLMYALGKLLHIETMTIAQVSVALGFCFLHDSIKNTISILKQK